MQDSFGTNRQMYALEDSLLHDTKDITDIPIYVPVAITGIWIRDINGKIQVIIERRGKEYLLFEEALETFPRTSHHFAVGGIRKAPTLPESK